MKKALLAFLICIFSVFAAFAKGKFNKITPEPEKEVHGEGPVLPVVEGKDASILEPATEAAELGMYAVGQTREFEEFAAWEFEEMDEFADILNIPEVAKSDIGLPLDSVRYYVDYAHSLWEKVKQENRFTDFINTEVAQDFPIAIVKRIGNMDYGIVIDSLILTPTHAYINVFMSLPIPNSERKLAFMGRKIRFTKNGGLTGDARIELLEDYPLNILGEKAQIVFKSGGGKTFVEFDCNGFSSMGVSADVEFSRDFFLPEGPDGKPLANGRVKGSFQTVLHDWSDLVAQISLDPFQVKGLDGFSFEVKKAIFDFSDVANAPGMEFPAEYDLPPVINLWQGIYMKELTIKLPQQFETTDGKRTQFEAHNVLIDNQGFTGTLLAKNLITREKGTMNGWAFSLDHIEVELRANQLRSGNLRGGLQVPVFEEGTELGYNAVMSNGGKDYLFSVETKNDIGMSIWAAKADLYASSTLEVELVNGKFKPRANLNGKMTIDASFVANDQGKSTGSDGGKKGVRLPDISFEGMEVLSEAPYVKLGNFSFGSPNATQKMSNFPVSIQEIAKAERPNNEIGLSFRIVLNLVGSDDGGFGADTKLTVVGGMDESGSMKSWRFKKVEVDEAGIDIDGGAYKIKGRLIIFREDRTYGSGFSGAVEAEFTPGIKVNATAIFGTVNGMRYWYADAMAVLPRGIPIVTGLVLNGFGGGCYYKMRQQGFNEGGGSNIGRSSSGIVYVPDPNTFLGLKASVNIATDGSEQAFNGDATFEIAFNTRGGVNFIGFNGSGYFITPPVGRSTEKLAAQAKALSGGSGGNSEASTDRGQLSADIRLAYNVENKTLDGVLNVYVNVAGGLVRGIGPNNSAGQALLHFSPQEWYIQIGSPDNRIGLEMMRVYRSESYFMVGTSLPASPPPPSNVSSILGRDFDYMRDMNALSSGGGFAFGSSLTINTGDLKFMMFYGRFTAGAGFDIMLKNYGPEARCSGSTTALGINGWYANGQAYAYLEGNIGINVDLKFYKGSYDIMEIGAAAILQAKLPNPVWMQGTVGGRFNILNGLVKGSCRFEVTIGEQCEIKGGSALAGTQIIAEVTPGEGEKDVNVFNSPQVVFNVAVGHVFEIVDQNNQTKAFRVKLDHFRVMNGSSQIQGTLQWNSDKDVLAFNSRDILPSKKQLTASVRVSFEERVNGVWVALQENGRVVTESMEVKFTTGYAPDYIPLDQVAYSYPIINQFNFHKDEATTGYIKLKKGMPELFEVTNEWRQVGRFTATTGEKVEFNFRYSRSNTQINFTIPSSQLANDKIYAFELINVPKNASGPIDANVDSVITVLASSEELDMEMKTKEAEGTLTSLQEKPIFSAHFRTSKYNNFNHFFNSLAIGNHWARYLYPGVYRLQVDSRSYEEFEKVALLGNQFCKPLIQIEAELTGNTWFVNDVHPVVYEGYPLLNKVFITNRNIEELGIPPSKAIFVWQRNYDRELTFNDISQGVNSSSGSNLLLWRYDLPVYIDRDYQEIINYVANLYVSQPISSSRISKLFTSKYPTIKNGNYRIKINYVLPGKETPNSTILYDIKYN
jgi:hypothetical protein